jgi:hypothetical protein
VRYEIDGVPGVLDFHLTDPVNAIANPMLDMLEYRFRPGSPGSNGGNEWSHFQ